MRYNFLNNYKSVIGSYFYQELPSRLQSAVLRHITQTEKHFFRNFFKDIFTNYRMPRHLVAQMVSQVTCYQVMDDRLIVKYDEEVKHVYLIKSGSIRLMDRYYNFMYELRRGSYFGELQTLFGLRSDSFYGISTHAKEDNILFKISGLKFLQIIVQDFQTFQQFFNSAIQRHRFQSCIKQLCLEKMLVASDKSRIKQLRKQHRKVKIMKFYDLLHLSRIHFGESNTHIQEFFEDINYKRMQRFEKRVR